MWKIFRNFEKFFLKIPKSDGIFQKILKLAKIFHFSLKNGVKITNVLLIQKFCENNRSELKSMKKAKKVVGETVGVLWECNGVPKKRIDFSQKIR